jgi:hypothetical protein
VEFQGIWSLHQLRGEKLLSVVLLRAFQSGGAGESCGG